jgi:hypothetical protein
VSTFLAPLEEYSPQWSLSVRALSRKPEEGWWHSLLQNYLVFDLMMEYAVHCKLQNEDGKETNPFRPGSSYLSASNKPKQSINWHSKGSGDHVVSCLGEVILKMWNNLFIPFSFPPHKTVKPTLQWKAALGRLPRYMQWITNPAISYLLLEVFFFTYI